MEALTDTDAEAEAIAILNRMDDKNTQLASSTIYKLGKNVLCFQDGLAEIVYYRLKESIDNCYAAPALLKLETTEPVNCLSYFDSIDTLHPLVKLALKELPDFRGYCATQTSNGAITNVIGNHSVDVFHNPIIMHVQDPWPDSKMVVFVAALSTVGYRKVDEDEIPVKGEDFKQRKKKKCIDENVHRENSPALAPAKAILSDIHLKKLNT